MTKAEVVNEIARRTGIEKILILETIEQFMDVVKSSLASDESVYLRGFGSFLVKERAPKTARNISKNVTIQIPARRVPSFKPSKTFIGIIDKPAGKK